MTRDKSIGLVGFGASSKALALHFLPLGYNITIHSYEPIALPSGASGCFGENYLVCNEDIVFRSPSVRPDMIKATGRVLCESEYALSQLGGVKICITGSDGKTTTSTLIHKALCTEHNAFLGGNIGIPLTNAIGKNYDFIVSELSSFQLMDYAPTCDVAVITNITPNHLNWHKSMDEYKSAKESVLKNARHRVLCYDSMPVRALASKYKSVSLFSLSDLSGLGYEGAYLKNEYIYLNDTRLISKNELSVMGDFNLLNVMACACATQSYVSRCNLIQAIREFKGVTHRCELVKKINGISLYNSSIDTTPSRTIATLSAFDKSKTIVILGGQDKGVSFEPLKSALASLRGAIVFGQSKDKILPHLKCKSYVVNTLKEAVLCALSIARVGDFIVLSPACTSFDMFKDYKERGETFCKIANEIC